MHSQYLVALAIFGFGYSSAQDILECSDASAQCCWTIRSFQMMKGSDERISAKYAQFLSNEEACCYMTGVVCAASESGKVIVKSM